MENSKTVNGLHSRRKQVETGKVIFASQLSTTTVTRTRSTSIELMPSKLLYEIPLRTVAT